MTDPKDLKIPDSPNVQTFGDGKVYPSSWIGSVMYWKEGKSYLTFVTNAGDIVTREIPPEEMEAAEIMIEALSEEYDELMEEIEK
jgi:hypothetical protein